jgi:hypothetical protein
MGFGSDLESKQKSSVVIQWLTSSEKRSRDTFVCNSNDYIVFASKDIIPQHCVSHSQTVNGECYADTLKTAMQNIVWGKRDVRS